MAHDLTIRDSTPADLAAIRRIYPLAFPDEDLLTLVGELLAGRDDVLSLVAERAGQVAGHVIYTHCGVEGSAVRAALLGPLAVLPELHGQGIGSALVRAGLDRLAAEGVDHVDVLGDPAYYSRFGFRQDDLVQPPYLLPQDWAPAWQSLPLGGDDAVTGVLQVPGPWQVPAYWQP